MAFKYYPASRIRTGLKTGGNQYTLNGRPYSGAYYLTYKGEAYTGANPATGPNELLTPRVAETAVSANRLLKRKSALAIQREAAEINRTQIVPGAVVELKQIVPYYPVVTESDYQLGYFVRFFAKKVNMNSYIMEISYESYINITENTDVSYEDYQAVKMFWQLTGPLNTVRLSQYEVKAGVSDTNKRVTENTAKGFRGLVEYIGGNYTKFARIAP